jgi:hypothetical protein
MWPKPASGPPQIGGLAIKFTASTQHPPVENTRPQIDRGWVQHFTTTPHPKFNKSPWLNQLHEVTNFGDLAILANGLDDVLFKNKFVPNI